MNYKEALRLLKQYEPDAYDLLSGNPKAKDRITVKTTTKPTVKELEARKKKLKMAQTGGGGLSFDDDIAPRTGLTVVDHDRTLKTLESRKDKAKSPKEKLEITSAYNDTLRDKNTKILSETKMDGTNRSILEEMEEISKMKSGKEKNKRKKAVFAKMEQLGIGTDDYALYSGDTNFDWGDFLKWGGNAAMSGLASFNKGITSTADLILGKPLEALGWENNPISKLDDHYEGIYETYKYNTDLYKQKLGGGKGYEFAGEAIEGTTGAVPNAILALMTMGGSAATSTANLTNKAIYETGNVLTKAGLTVENMMRNPQYWMSFARTYGSDYEEAKSMGVDDTTAVLGATLTSLLNAGIEIGPDGMSGIEGLPQEAIEGGTSKLWSWIKSNLSEGGEEGLQKFVNEAVAKLVYGSEEDILDPMEYAKEMSIGALSGAALGGGQLAVQSAVNTANNAVMIREANKLSADEQKVFDKLYEKEIAEAEKEGEVSHQKKKEIENKVRRELERGYVPIETIEEILGEESYSAYDSLLKEQKEFNTLYETEGGKLSEKQRDRLNELKAKNEQTPYEKSVKEARDKLFGQVLDRTKGSRLAESYRELVRRTKDFEVDLTQYENETQRKTMQNILDSGMLNDSNEVHDFADLLGQISADRGTVFNITSTEKLKGTEHYREGFITDGFITSEDGSITINMDSPKALNFVVGHEVTHSLEKTKAYKDLQTAVFQYAEGKGELHKYLESVEGRYKDLDRVGKDKELTSDLIGRYLFTDYDFISNLSANHRNVFQKVYDEVKYLCKIATAGSKAARDLERVKHQFEKAYRETKAKTDANYSLTPVDAVKPTSSAWKSGANTDEVRSAHPTLYAVDEDATETRNPTQVKNTVSSYRKVYSFLQSEGFDGKILDASSGLGLGTQAGIDEFGFQVEDIEPYPDKNYNPKYTDYSALDETYDAIISNAVLNVIPQDQRDALVTKMGQMLNPGGRMFINVRGKDVLNSSGKIAINEANMEYFIPRTAKTGSYQKGFTTDELKAYLEDALGDEFVVTDGRKIFGTSSPSAIVTRKGGLEMAYAAMDDISRSYLENKSIQYSYSAIPTHRKSLEKNYSPTDASMDLETINQRYDKIIGIWEKLGGELDSKFLNDWNNKVERPFTIFKAQSGYKYNVELSSMCKKGVPLFEAIDTIVKKEVMRELDMDVMGKDEKEILYDILKQKHFEIPCAICYVEQARQREGVIIDAFLNGKTETDNKGNAKEAKLGWNQVIDAIQKEMKANGVDYNFGFVSRDIATDKYVPADSSMDEQTYAAFAEAVKKLANEEIARYNQSKGKNRPLLTEVTPEAVNKCFKGALPSNLKIFKVLLTEPSSRFKIQNDLLYSSMTTKNLTMAHNGLYSLFNSQGGVSGYKTKQSPTVYWGEILGKKWKPEATRKEGGVRNQSNSDFQMYTLLDQAQMYMDFSAKGYYLQAYTKVLSELKLFGLSRGKINASLIPQVKVYRNADGTVDVEKTMANAGLDENGNPIYDDIEGIDHREAFMLLEDPNYSKNIGGICIGYSDNHIRKLLDDSRVQLIIGFHDKTNDPNKRYRGARYAKNYNGLNEATKQKADGTSETVHIGFNPFIKKAENKFKYNKETETFEGTVTYNGKNYTADDIPRLATDLYLEHCAKKNLTPAYDEFHEHQNYYKLLADFSLYDSEGHYAPHQKVAYNMPDTVPYLDADGNKQFMKSEDYIKIELQKELAVRDSLIDALADDSEDGIIPKFKAEVEKRKGTTQYSMTKADSDYMDAVNRGDTETAQKMVDEAAKAAGYPVKAYHGTPKFGYTVFDPAMSDDKTTLFFTESLDVAKTYAGRDVYGTKQISDAKSFKYERGRKYTEAELKEAHDFIQSKYHVYGQTKINAEKQTVTHAGTRYSAKQIMEMADRIAKVGVYGVYLNTDGFLKVDANGKTWAQLDIPDDFYEFADNSFYGENASIVYTRDYAKYAKAKGYRGLTITNVYDVGNRNLPVSHRMDREGTAHSTIHILFDSNQVKSADPVTYDDSGNVIPLSERFNTENNDIRYSLSEDEGYEEYGNYNVYGKDMKLQSDEDIPIAEVAENATTEESSATVSETESVPSDDDIPIKTVKERLTAQRSNSQTELENNRKLREEATKSYDDKIAKAQAQLDSKKNKDTKVANNLRRRIERLQRLKGDVDAQYAKRISDIETRIGKADEELQKDHTKQDQYERTISRINRMLEMEKADLDAEFAQKRELLAKKDSYISTKASELYQEIRNLKKGVKASEQLGYLLDHGYEWSSIRSALVNIKHTPGETVNINSEAENVAREMLNDDFEQAHFDLDAEYQSRLSELEAEAETKRQAAKVANQRMVKHQEYAEQMELLIGDTSTWVDKKMGISYKVNTLRRNLRDIVRDAEGNLDIDRADAIYDELQGKYNHNEAMLHREATRIKSPYAKLKITNAEDAYIQMLGELRHNPETTLTEDAVNEFYEKHKKHIDTAKVDRVIESARETYDTLLERVNEVLREQGMKEIPYRQGYFPHFTEPKQGWLAKLLNWKTKDFDIPTDIAGLTENFNPNRSWQSFNKQRKSDTTDYSFMKGMDTYVQGALDWIYHIEDIQKRRAFENHIRYVHSEKGVQKRIDEIRKNTQYDAEEMQEQIDLVYKEAGNPLNNFVTDFRAGTNTLANKKSSLDRGMEELVNRKVYSTMTNLSNRVTGNMVVGSFSSALTNFIPITQSWVEVSPVSSLRAMGETIKSTIRDDGIVDKSDFLTNRLRQSEALFKTNWDKVSDMATFMMEAIDSFTSQTVWRSKYLENISSGMSETEAIRNADQFAMNVIADRSRGNMPTIFDSKNPLIRTLTAFQLEVNNQYQYMFKDAPQDMKDKSVGKLVKGYATAFLGAYAYNALYSSLVGRDAAFDPIGILEELFKDIFGDDEEEPSEIILGLTDNILEEVPFVGGLLGGGRIPISSALPYDGLYEAFKGTVEDVADKDWKGLTKEWMNPLWYLAMPLGGGQIRKTYQGLSMFDDDLPISGSYTDSGKLRFPVEDTPLNRIQAGMFGQYSSKNARDYFDNNRSALGEKQIDEFSDLDIPIRDYWEYREGLKGLETLGEKADYIYSLDLPIEKKNILINNIADRKEPINLTGYRHYGSFEEFDFAMKNPEKYRIAEAIGGYETYKEIDKHLNELDTLAEKADYIASLDMSTYGKNLLINDETDRKEPIDLTGYENYGSFKEFEYAKENPNTYLIAKASGGYDAYMKYSEELNDIRADKDKYGNSINGTRKSKIIDYLNNLDADYYTKIILFKNIYNADDTYNQEIIEYLNGRNDLSFEEKKTILSELGFYVDKLGNISW